MMFTSVIHKLTLACLFIVAMSSVSFSTAYELRVHEQGYVPGKPEVWFLVCPVTDIRSSSISAWYLLSNVPTYHVTITTCFVAAPDRWNEFKSQPIVYGGKTYNKKNQHVWANIHNYNGQAVMLLNNDASPEPVTELYSELSSNDVKIYNIDEYYIKNYCSNFVMRMTANCFAKQFDKVRTLMNEINSCTTLTVWARVQRDELAKVKAKDVTTQSVEIATKLVSAVSAIAGLPQLQAAKTLVDTFKVIEAIAKSVDALNKIQSTVKGMGTGSKSFENLIINVCQSYQVATDLGMRCLQENNQLSKNTSPSSTDGKKSESDKIAASVSGSGERVATKPSSKSSSPAKKGNKHKGSGGAVGAL